MTTDYLFKDLYHDRWGDPANPNAVGPPPSEGEGNAGKRGTLGWLTRFLHLRGRPSAWSFTIPSEVAERENTDGRHRNRHEDPKFLAIAKALSRNC
ncbi:hypothetical protein [Rhizobium lusitanum]|uniref:Uncharacterized protein n=1 Tax=Rhizobium lusitanum TaxID=293958 RepID=A0A7X0IVY6_9HYPH|nr:hypothetical protein [Rhizobium lusitanum]MBB6487632.1 hypothetical protein [Rhizobium lusitanum]